jgi:hypothetical protein
MEHTNRTARPRHVHLGERLEVIERIRRGALGIDEAARRCGVAREEVARWLEMHAKDRPLTLEEVVHSPDVVRLTRRAQRLAELIATSESMIRTLHRMLRSGPVEE